MIPFKPPFELIKGGGAIYLPNEEDQMTNDPTKRNPIAGIHSDMTDLRHEIVELRELLRSANCKARFMLAFSIFNLAALGVGVLMWVLT